MEQDGLDGEPGEEAGAEGELAPIGQAELGEAIGHHEAAGDERQIEHGRGGGGDRLPRRIRPVRQRPKASVYAEPRLNSTAATGIA